MQLTDDISEKVVSEGFHLFVGENCANVDEDEFEEKETAKTLRKKYADVESDGAPGKPDVVIHDLGKELECKLTSGSRSKGTISYSKNGKFNISKLTNNTIKWSGLKNLDLAQVVSTKKNYTWRGLQTWKKETGYKKNNKNLFHVVAVDYGIKKNILRYFSDFNCKVTVVSCKTNAQKILSLKPNGIFLSNGPGDPAATGKYSIAIINELIKNNLPIFGICLGHQILALALGGKTKKMKLGHRGANHPVKNLVHDKVEITSQNHGFVVVEETLPKKIEVTHKSLFDNTIEGIKLKNKPIFSVQYHPESNPGPQDSVYLFQEFINNMKKNAKKKRY